MSLGTVHRTADLDGLVAEIDGQPAGLLTWRFDDADGVEVVTVDALVTGPASAPHCCGPSAALTVDAGRARLWLITTNDNLPALRFYQQRGWDLVALHRHEVDQARELKPSIPAAGPNGIPTTPRPRAAERRERE